jgi:sugar lactone lactonase YvrE
VQACFLNTFLSAAGHGNEKLSKPEGLCMDNQGYVYIADSADNSISLIKGGHLHRKTGHQQSDLLCPQAICMDKNSCLYVANDSGKTLAVFDIIQENL